MSCCASLWEAALAFRWFCQLGWRLWSFSRSIGGIHSYPQKKKQKAFHFLLAPEGVVCSLLAHLDKTHLPKPDPPAL